jgi:hypothetical protein
MEDNAIISPRIWNVHNTKLRENMHPFIEQNQINGKNDMMRDVQVET